MEKVFSARMDEEYVYRLKKIAETLHASKKATLEKAIDLLWNKFNANSAGAFTTGFGIWQDRQETTDELSQHIKTEFRKSYVRHEQ